jgi:hypothetical protein
MMVESKEESKTRLTRNIELSYSHDYECTSSSSSTNDEQVPHTHRKLRKL